MLTTSFSYLQSCPLQANNICQVVGGYAKTFQEVVSNFPSVYHQIPIGTEVQVIKVEGDDITANAAVINMELGIIKNVTQIFNRRDLLLILNNPN